MTRKHKIRESSQTFEFKNLEGFKNSRWQKIVHICNSNKGIPMVRVINSGQLLELAIANIRATKPMPSGMTEVIPPPLEDTISEACASSDANIAWAESSLQKKFHPFIDTNWGTVIFPEYLDHRTEEQI